jgi:hypothetical protein
MAIYCVVIAAVWQIDRLRDGAVPRGPARRGYSEQISAAQIDGARLPGTIYTQAS